MASSQCVLPCPLSPNRIFKQGAQVRDPFRLRNPRASIEVKRDRNQLCDASISVRQILAMPKPNALDRMTGAEHHFGARHPAEQRAFGGKLKWSAAPSHGAPSDVRSGARSTTSAHHTQVGSSANEDCREQHHWRIVGELSRITHSDSGKPWGATTANRECATTCRTSLKFLLPNPPRRADCRE